MSPKKKNKGWKILLLLLALFIGLLLFRMIYGWLDEKTANFVRYKEFGIEMPVNYSIHGIDISHHQDMINWKEVKNMNVRNIRIGFAFIKASEGLNDKDRLFKRNWTEAGEVGMVRGAYHFFLPGKSGKEQAKNFIASVALSKGDLPPVLDIEQNFGTPAATLQREAKIWLQEVEAHYGVKPIIYSNVDFYIQNLNDPYFDNYPLWVAHYLEKQQPRIKRNWIIWQHNDKGNVNGIREKVDFNVFKGNSSDFTELLIQ
jgi:lysozyme